MIEFKNIQLTFNQGTAMETRALRGISMKIPQGEFVTVIGSNGAGKSTLLKCLTGVYSPQKGQVKINDLNITNWSPTRRSQHVAHVFQDPMLGTCADLSIEENMALAYRRGQTRNWKCFHAFHLALNKDLRDQFREYVSMLGMGLENRLKDPIGRLSGGQRQTLSLIMAVLSPMQILVLDEHTAALDPKMAAKVLDLTKKIVADRKLTTLMVTHSMHQALDAGTRTVMLHQGKVVLDLKGEERTKLNVHQLLDLFKEKSGSDVDDDKLILA